MLFGKRPFGHDQTQERILREDTIIKARKVEFPSRPSVSNEAKVSCTCSLIITVLLSYGNIRFLKKKKSFHSSREKDKRNEILYWKYLTGHLVV